jgi:hypothetical protein
LIFAAAVPALAQTAYTKPSPDEKLIDFRQHGLDKGYIGMNRGFASDKLTSADAREILGRTLQDKSGQSVGSIMEIRNDARGQPERVLVKIGMEDNAPIRTVPAQTINLTKGGRIMTSMTVAQVENQ